MMQLRNLSLFSHLSPQHSTTQSMLTASSLWRHPRVNKWNQFRVKRNSIKSTRRSLSIWCDGARIRTHCALDIRFLCLFHNSIYSIVFLYPHEKSTKQLLDICVCCAVAASQFDSTATTGNGEKSLSSFFLKQLNGSLPSWGELWAGLRALRKNVK